MNSKNTNLLMKYIERVNPFYFWDKIFQCSPSDTDLSKGVNSSTAMAIENVLQNFEGKFDAQIIGYPYALEVVGDSALRAQIRKKLIGAALVDISLKNNLKYSREYRDKDTSLGLVSIFADINELNNFFSKLNFENIIDLLPSTDYSYNSCPWFLSKGEPSIRLMIWDKVTIKSLLEIVVKKHLISIINDENLSMLDVGVYHKDIDFTSILNFADSEDRFRMNEILNEYSENPSTFDLESNIFYKTMIQNMYIRMMDNLNSELKKMGFKKIRENEFGIQFEDVKYLKPVLIRLLGDYNYKIIGISKRELMKQIDILLPNWSLQNLVIVPPDKNSIRYFNENYGEADYTIIMPQASKIDDSYNFQDGTIIEDINNYDAISLIKDLQNRFDMFNVQ